MKDTKEVFRILATRFHVSGERRAGAASAIGDRTFMHTDVGMIYTNTKTGVSVYYLERIGVLEPLVGTEDDFWKDLESWHVTV